ncbi:hypothetical protein D3C87_1212870 [compost metagenome]
MVAQQPGRPVRRFVDFPVRDASVADDKRNAIRELAHLVFESRMNRPVLGTDELRRIPLFQLTSAFRIVQHDASGN